MASEGMDIPSLNTVLLLASPKLDIKQSGGRILRRSDHEVLPTVIDVVDVSLPCFAWSLRVRKRFVGSVGFEVVGEENEGGWDGDVKENAKVGGMMFRT